jgi:hypothetical protein
VLLGVALAALAGGIVGVWLFRGDGDSAKKKAVAPSAVAVRWTDATPYDPPSDGGDGAEHDSEAANAIDKNPATYWTTESYQDFKATKPGVGIVLAAPRRVTPKRLTVVTDTPGFTAVIKAGSSPTGPFRQVSSSQVTSSTTTYALRGGGRYFLVWITDLSDHAHINEVRAR